MEYPSEYTKDHFDFVIDDANSDDYYDVCDRWPDEYAENAPPIKRVPTSAVFYATQPRVSASTAYAYAQDLKAGRCSMPPVVCLKCPGGYIVWNGHHRLTAHRLAGRKTIKAQVWGEVEKPVAVRTRED